MCKEKACLLYVRIVYKSGPFSEKRVANYVIQNFGLMEKYLKCFKMTYFTKLCKEKKTWSKTVTQLSW